MQNGAYLFAAFALVWAVVFIYVIALLRRQRGLKQEIESLKSRLGERQGGG